MSPYYIPPSKIEISQQAQVALKEGDVTMLREILKSPFSTPEIWRTTLTQYPSLRDDAKAILQTSHSSRSTILHLKNLLYLIQQRRYDDVIIAFTVGSDFVKSNLTKFIYEQNLTFEEIGIEAEDIWLQPY